MVMRITWGKLRPGTWRDFERTYRASLPEGTKPIKGLRGRWLAQDSTDENAGFAMSLWDSTADMQRYEQSSQYSELSTVLQPFFAGEYRTYHCELKHAEMAEAGKYTETEMEPRA
jgi:heme-degrading monooxygenase HmoA